MSTKNHDTSTRRKMKRLRERTGKEQKPSVPLGRYPADRRSSFWTRKKIYLISKDGRIMTGCLAAGYLAAPN